MEKPYSPTGSERPVSQGVASTNIPANESVNSPVRENGTVDGTGVVDTSHADVPVSAEVDEGRSGPEVFFLSTLVFAIIAWLIILVAQAVVAATIDNARVRILWFGFLVQTALIFLVFVVWKDRPEFTAAYGYGTQIAIFSAITTGFAVVGVDRTIYSSRAAEQATGVGWLLTAIVDLLWIIFFTSPPGSPVFLVTDTLAAARFQRRSSSNPVTKINRSSGAFAMRPVQRENVRMSQGPVATPARNTMASIPGSSGGDDKVPSAAVSEGNKVEQASHAASSFADVNAKGRAEAMFDYGGSDKDPHELAFKKGEVLLIFNTENKWWEAKTPDGRKGIAPSNYLRLL